MINIISPASFNHTMSALEELEACKGIGPILVDNVKNEVIRLMEEGIQKGYDTYLTKFP